MQDSELIPEREGEPISFGRKDKEDWKTMAYKFMNGRYHGRVTFPHPHPSEGGWFSFVDELRFSLDGIEFKMTHQLCNSSDYPHVFALRWDAGFLQSTSLTLLLYQLEVAAYETKTTMSKAAAHVYLPPLFKNPIAELNEACQKNGYGYDFTFQRAGEIHAPTWRATCICSGDAGDDDFFEFARMGSGPTKQAARAEAAKLVLQELHRIKTLI